MNSSIVSNRFAHVVVPSNLCQLPPNTVAAWIGWLMQNGDARQLNAAAWQLRLCSVKPYYRGWFQALYARASELQATTLRLRYSPPVYPSPIVHALSYDAPIEQPSYVRRLF